MNDLEKFTKEFNRAMYVRMAKSFVVDLIVFLIIVGYIAIAIWSFS